MVEYHSTWGYGYDFMLDAAQVIIDSDFKENTQRFAVAEIAGAEDQERLTELKAENFIIRNCDTSTREHGVLTISGMSDIMECPIQIVFFNQTNIVRLFCPFKKYFEIHGEHAFDNYMNSIEIKAYCADAVRKSKTENWKFKTESEIVFYFPFYFINQIQIVYINPKK